jgi:hypothetical protein
MVSWYIVFEIEIYQAFAWKKKDAYNLDLFNLFNKEIYLDLRFHLKPSKLI